MLLCVSEFSVIVHPLLYTSYKCMYKNYSINEWPVNEGDFVDYPPHGGVL